MERDDERIGMAVVTFLHRRIEMEAKFGSAHGLRNELHFRLKELLRLVQCSRFLPAKDQKCLCLLEARRSGKMISSQMNDELKLVAQPVGRAKVCPRTFGSIVCPLRTNYGSSHTAARVHSRYTRQFVDLPCGGQQVRLRVLVRKYFCDVPTCARKIFVERLTPFAQPWARVTLRLYQIVQVIGLATGGRLGVRVTDRLNIQTSRMTILRRIMALETSPAGPVSQIGIDDFSFRRGRKFGTIVVDLQTRKQEVCSQENPRI